MFKPYFGYTFLRVYILYNYRNYTFVCYIAAPLWYPICTNFYGGLDKFALYLGQIYYHIFFLNMPELHLLMMQFLINLVGTKTKAQ